MSRDLKITEFDISGEKPKYNVIDYFQIMLDGFDCWEYIVNNKNKGYFAKENKYNTLLTRNAYMFDKDVLKDLLNKYDKECSLKEKLLSIISKIQYKYIVLQCICLL
jgi:ADP-glucose pyrophosphorylase